MSTTPRFDKSRLPSRHVTEGPARAPHRIVRQPPGAPLGASHRE